MTRTTPRPRVPRWVFVVILVACGQPQTSPLKATNFPDSIFMEPSDPLNANGPGSIFEFSMKGENILSGSLKESNFDIEILNVELHQLSLTTSQPIVLAKRSYPVNFSGEGVEYRFSIDFIKNIELNPQDMYSIHIYGCKTEANGKQNRCILDGILLSINP